MTTDFSKTFAQMVADAGLPTTQEQAKAQWEAVATSGGSPYNNSDEHSPFWRTIKALVTTPVLWLVQNLMLVEILPNMFLQTASKTFLEFFGWAVDLQRKQATKAQGNLLFSRVVAVGELIIPAGTVVQSPVINGRTYHLVTLSVSTLADGVTSAIVQAQAADVGAGYNLPAGFYAVMPEPLPGIDSVTNTSDWLTSAGADEEKDDDYRFRIRNQFSAVNQYHTDSVYKKIITEFANINTRNIFFEHNAPRGPGTANAYILMDVGQPSAELLASIESYVMNDGNHGHGDDLRLFAMPDVQYNLVVTIRAKSNATAQEVTALVDDVYDAVSAAFRQNDQYAVTVTQPLSEFAFSRLAGELHTLFENLAAVKFSLDDITSNLNIPRLNSLQVELDD